MKDFLTGGALTGFALLVTVLLHEVHPYAPYIAYVLFLLAAYGWFIKGLIDAINRGEAPNFNVFTNPWL